MTGLTQQLLDQKRQRRRLLAQLSFPEKVRIMEKLRDASKRMALAAPEAGAGAGIASRSMKPTPVSQSEQVPANELVAQLTDMG